MRARVRVRVRRHPPSTHRTFDVDEIDKSESSRDILAEPTLLFSEAEKQKDAPPSAQNRTASTAGRRAGQLGPVSARPAEVPPAEVPPAGALRRERGGRPGPGCRSRAW
ncbi:hypothetical protein GTX53_26840 [Streptomyces sp. SID5594]|nr:hypothetical protein [Streptomyces sp. SID5594]